jgi:hypothetical protein
VASLVQDFDPDVVQITGPSDVGMLGALIAHKLSVPLAASWQTNLHQYARSRLSPALSLLPKSSSTRLLSAVERWPLRAAMRFYKIPRLLFAPNREMEARLPIWTLVFSGDTVLCLFADEGFPANLHVTMIVDARYIAPTTGEFTVVP